MSVFGIVYRYYQGSANYKSTKVTMWNSSKLNDDSLGLGDPHFPAAVTLSLSNTSTTTATPSVSFKKRKKTPLKTTAKMPTAEAKLGDLLLASASSWEEVEGNIYV